MIEPLRDMVVVKIEKAQERSAGGIILPATRQQQGHRAKVLCVGPGYFDAGRFIPTTVKEGDAVLLDGNSFGVQVEVGGENCLIVRERELLGRWKSESAEQAA